MCAPSLLIGLINTFMFKKRDVGWVDPDGNEKFNCHLSQWYPNQVDELASVAFQIRN